MHLSTRPMGDQALLLDCRDYQEASERAADLREAGLAEIEDIVPAARSVLVIFGPPADFDRRATLVKDALATAAGRPAPAPAEQVELRVRYDGPDLRAVADMRAMSIEEVIRRHVAAEYTVMFVGFVPGFAYLAGLDPALHVARRADPRTDVPAGSVAIASDMSAVYPRSGPGGWQLLGTTTATLFDPDRPQPSLLTAGSRVRFVPQ